MHINVEFLNKLGKSSTEIYSLMTEVYGKRCLLITKVFEWFMRFIGERKTFKMSIPQPLFTLKTDENIQHVARVVPDDLSEHMSNW